MQPSDIPAVLRIMEREAIKRNAPVLKVESAKRTPFQVLVFVLLSSRTKDWTTLRAAEKLFAAADRPEKIARLRLAELESIIYGVGFYRTKARNLVKLCRTLVEEFNGKVPDTLEELLTLPGIGRKSANIVLASCFGRKVIGVDTHVHRISNRLGIVKTKKREGTERALMKIVPDQYKAQFNRILVAYGQTICVPLSPFCSICRLNGRYCQRAGVDRSR